jgi:coproporphyrinogen III oxidase-like Fe-S oxidoreductase
LAGALSTYHQVEALDEPTQLTERLMLGLRLREGVNVAELKQRYETAFAQRQRAIDKQLGLGKLELTDDLALRVPYAHWLFADGIIANLV